MIRSVARRMAVLLAAAAAMAAAPAQADWVASWAAPPQPPSLEGANATPSFENVTLAHVLRISEGGERVRLRFTNRYGTGPLVIGQARIVRIDDAGAEIAGTSRMLTFGGQAGAVVPAGAPYVSDPVAVDLPDLSRLKVEFFLPEPTGPCTCHPLGLDLLAVSAPGNHVGQAWVPATTMQQRAFLHAVEVDSAEAPGTIVVFGDSITDGYGSTPGANRRWPDVLAERLQAAGMEWAVASAAISGNRVLSQGAGEPALARFDDDVLSLPGARYLILFEGVNDLGNRYGPNAAQEQGPDALRVTPAQMIAGYRQLIDRARAQGITVIGAPIAPYKGAGYWSPEGEAARLAINEWIINGGAFDAVVRFDRAVADPADAAVLREGLHTGDFLHPDDAGLRAIAEAIPLDLFGAPEGEDAGGR